MDERTLKYDKYLNYCNRVLVGNWFEQQSAYKKNKFLHASIYSTEFVKKPLTTNDPGLIWDEKIKAEGGGVYPVNTSEEIPNYYENFSTTYDLTYNHFPNWYGTPIFRDLRFRLERHEPFDEYISSYGNITKTGLAQYKKLKWKGEIQDPRTTSTTSYEDTYTTPEDSSYKFERWSRKVPKIENNPRYSKCNPITWECIDEPFQQC